MEPASSPAAFRSDHDQHGYRGRLEWGRTGVELLAGTAELVVIVDVLTFSTAISIAVERGAAVIPYPLRDGTAMERARALGATFASPNRGAPGPTVSPASLEALRPGERLLLPAPNGATCSLLAAKAGAMVVAGCLRNASAIGRFAAGRGWTTAVVPAGEEWPDRSLRPAVEDLIGAGAILAAMDVAGLAPEARAAVAAFAAWRDDPAATLAATASGRELVTEGFERDVAIAEALDVTDRIPVLVDGVFRSVVG